MDINFTEISDYLIFLHGCGKISWVVVKYKRIYAYWLCYKVSIWNIYDKQEKRPLTCYAVHYSMLSELF